MLLLLNLSHHTTTDKLPILTTKILDNAFLVFYLNSVAPIFFLIFMMPTQYPFNSNKWIDMAGIQVDSLGEF